MNTKARLLSLINERHWTIYRLAKESGVTWTTIRNMYARNTDPSITTLESLCRGLGITLCQFFDEENSMGLSQEQANLLKEWSKLNSFDKKIILSLIKSLSDKG